MQSSKINEIRQKRQLIRKNIKCTLKLPNLNTKILQPNLSVYTQHKQNPPDKRQFQNVFDILDKLGQGSNGVVKKCRQKKTGDIYAVKITKGDDQLIRITKRTYQILKIFNHPSIIKGKYLFIDERKDTIYLVMEYCQYQSLASLIRLKRFQLDFCKKLIKKLLEALTQIHSKGVCHRDLKPDNILYNQQRNQIKIIDFGVSKSTYNRKTHLKQKMWTVTGTIQYKAPEMFSCGQYDQKIDAWAVGVIAYQLIYGKLPFQSQLKRKLIKKISQQQPIYQQIDNSECSLTIDFLKALLKKNPHQRINSFEALRHPWIQNKQQIKTNKKSTSEDCFSIQFFNFNRQRNNTLLQKTMQRINNSSEMNAIKQIQNQSIQKIKNQWNEFQIGKDIHQIHRQNNQASWISLKRSVSKQAIMISSQNKNSSQDQNQ